ncbi:hypothetical protein LMH73_014410, partial [Vibrio splendidus]
MKRNFINLDSIAEYYNLSAELSLEQPNYVQYVKFPIFAQNEGNPVSVTIGDMCGEQYHINPVLTIQADHILEGMAHYLESGDHDGIESIDLLMVDGAYRLVVTSEDESKHFDEKTLTEALAHIGVIPVQYSIFLTHEFLPNSFIAALSLIDVDFWQADSEYSDFDIDVLIKPKTEEHKRLSFTAVVSFNRIDKKVSVAFGCDQGDGFECFASIYADEQQSTRELIIAEIKSVNDKSQLRPELLSLTTEHADAFEKSLSILDSLDT